MKLLFVPLTLVIALSACGGSGSPIPTGPSPTPAGPPASPQAAQSQLAGYVYDSALRRLAFAKIEVVDGPEAGKSTTADANGQYRLTGVFDDETQFRATKDGYLAGSATRGPICAPCNPNWWLSFYLAVPAPPVNIAGDYTMTFSADAVCAELPDEARTRSYAATIAVAPNSRHPADTRFEVTVAGSQFLDRYKSFVIFVADHYLTSDIGDWGHGSPGLVEQVAVNTYLTLGGGIAASVTTPSTMSFSMYGDVDRCELATEWGSRYSCSSPTGAVTRAHCPSQAHQLVLTRR